MDDSPYDTTLAGPAHQGDERPNVAGPVDEISDGTVEMVLSQEQMSVQLVRTAVETVRVSRRVVTETVQVPVTIRREELSFTRLPVSGSPEGQAARQPVEDLVLVLHEEVPLVSLQVRATERVTIGVRTVAGEQRVSADLRREDVQLDDHGLHTRRS